MTFESHEKVSVVIATLGGDSLHETIKKINSGTVVPDEIIISIPEQYFFRVNGLKYENIKVLKTLIKGQVAQRVIGFKEAAGDFVLQVDDDILLNESCIEELIKTLKSNGRKSVAGAAFYEVSTDKPLYKKIEKNKILQNLYYWLVNGKDGYMQGIIDKAGMSIGVNYTTLTEDEFMVEWLAGGCVAHYKDNLILEDFYPYKGKAYCEDLIHSYLLSSVGCKLVVNKYAKCHIDIFRSHELSFNEYWDFFKSDYKARAYFVGLSDKSLLRMHFHYAAWFSSYLYNSTFR